MRNALVPPNRSNGVEPLANPHDEKRIRLILTSRLSSPSPLSSLLAGSAPMTANRLGGDEDQSRLRRLAGVAAATGTAASRRSCGEDLQARRRFRPAGATAARTTRGCGGQQERRRRRPAGGATSRTAGGGG